MSDLEIKKTLRTEHYRVFSIKDFDEGNAPYVYELVSEKGQRACVPEGVRAFVYVSPLTGLITRVQDGSKLLMRVEEQNV